MFDAYYFTHCKTKPAFGMQERGEREYDVKMSTRQITIT
jgi:hypothetical protein